MKRRKLDGKVPDNERTSGLNIMYIAHERKMGGATLCLFTMAKEMKERGHNVCVVVPFGRSPIADNLRKEGIKTIGIFFGWWMMPEYWGPFMKFCFRVLYASEWLAVCRISRRIKNEKIDIVHSNSSVIDVGSRAAKRCDVPHVWHFREFGDKDYRLEFLKGRRKSIEYIAESGSFNVFISECLKRYYKELNEPGKNVVIYDGVSENYLNGYKAIRTGHVTFLIAGNLQRNKGQDTVLKAVKILKKRSITDFSVIIAGGVASTADSRKFAKELYEYKEAENLNNVYFVGFVEDMKDLRKKTDVEIVASRMEAFGRVTVEAMLSGNPVLATNTGANPELIKEGETGWLFREGDAEDLADKIQNILNVRSDIRMMGNNAYDRMKREGLSNRNTEEIEMLYRKILKQKL